MDEGRVTRAAAQAADLAREQEENKTGSNGSNLSEKLDMIAETLTEMTRQQSQIIQALAGGNSENQTVPAFVSSVNRTPATAPRVPPTPPRTTRSDATSWRSEQSISQLPPRELSEVRKYTRSPETKFVAESNYEGGELWIQQCEQRA